MGYIEKLFGEYEIQYVIVEMGSDYTVSVFGGSRPHVSSVVMNIPRPSLTGIGGNCTSSVLNGIGHKDGVIARLFAETVAMQKNAIVVCSCRIHIDDADTERLREITRYSERLLKHMMAELEVHSKESHG